MSGLKVFFIILAIAIFVVVEATMIILERDKPKKMILWSLIFLLTNIVGGIVYFVIKFFTYKKRSSLLEKEQEDLVYDGLVNKDLTKNHVSTKDEIFAFNKRAYGASLTTKNNVEIINSYSKFIETLTKDLNNADKYIIFEVTKINVNNFSNIKDTLISKAQDGVCVKFIYEEFIPFQFIKELKKSGVKVYKFSKHNIEHTYSNHRNLITIDGEIAYMGNFYIKQSQIQQKVHSANMYLRLKGEIVQDVDVAVHKDVVFASGKFVEYEGKFDTLSSVCNAQFISNEISDDIELMLTKAICGAKSSIQLLLTQFIPTENIVSLLKYAINSNISV
ncbi:MAG: hypothetical protein MJ152_02085, partial [Clostridia bacterium]|nr:hypothetical protein [Clostridia bacterium]